MRKITDLFTLRIIASVFNIVLAIFVFFGDLDSEIGLILPSSISWIPSVLLVIIFALLLLETIKRIPMVRLLYFLIVIFSIILLISYGLPTVNASIWFFGLIYMIMMVVTLLTSSKEDQKPKKEQVLPAMVYSKKQFILNNASIFLAIVLVIAFVAIAEFIKLDTWQALLIALPLVIIIVPTILIKADPLRPIIKLMNKEANYAKFCSELDKLYAENLNKETKSYLDLVKVGYLFSVDLDQANLLFEEIKKPTNKIYLISYEITEISYYTNKKEYDKAKELIALFEQKYPKNKACKSIIELIRLSDSNEVSENIENTMPINTLFKFINLCNAQFLLNYYKNRNQIDKAKNYANFILDANSDLEMVNKDAKEMLLDN